MVCGLLYRVVPRFLTQERHLQHLHQEVLDELTNTQAQLDVFSNNRTVAYIVCDLQNRIKNVNSTFVALFDYRAEEVIGKKLPIIPTELAPEFGAVLMENNWNIPVRETLRQRKDGSTFEASETIAPIHNAAGQTVGFAIILRDITERKQQERHIKESEQRYKSLFQHNPDAIFSLDLDGNFVKMNPAVQQMSGYPSAELMSRSILSLIVEEDREHASVSFHKTKTGNTEHYELAILHKTGRRIELGVTMIPIIIDGEIVGTYGIAKDITDSKQAQATINHLAYHDSLTELPNRRLFEDRLVEAIQEAEEQDQMLSVLFLDLDRFKIINDSMGHGFGDLMLQSVAQRLTACVREFDTVARMGGDEFTLLLPNIGTMETTTRIADQVLETFKEPLKIDGHELHITPSIGISVYPNDGQDAVTLMKNADTAMYRAKEQGKNNYQLYTPLMNTQVFKRLELERELRKALEREEFVLFYQPQISSSTGKIIGMEALIRWQHPERGLLSPFHFIPLAEETGLIVPIGEWVLRAACRQNKAWQDAGLPPLHVAVNLSMIQFQQKDLIETVVRVLQETGLHPQYLELEITESIAMHNTDYVIGKLNELVNLGVQISIDDFGTGFSSLNYLKKFPINKLKIDRSFITDITSDSDDALIVTAIIAMAHSLKLNVIVEGVETEAQRSYLPTLGCDEMQGYLFSAPVPPREFMKMLEEGYCQPKSA